MLVRGITGGMTRGSLYLGMTAGSSGMAADASLYYLADLRRRLSHHYTVDRRAPYGELLIAALRAWGDRFAQYLEGDYAIIAWHRASGRVLLARDFVGKRPLAMTITATAILLTGGLP